MRRLSQKRGSMNPMSAPIRSTIGLRRPGNATDTTTIRIGTPTMQAAQITRYSLTLQPEVGAGDLAGEVRAEVALLDDLVELGHGLARLERLAARPPCPEAPAAGFASRPDA